MESITESKSQKDYRYWTYLNGLPILKYIRRIKLFKYLYGVSPRGYTISKEYSGIWWK